MVAALMALAVTGAAGAAETLIVKSTDESVASSTTKQADDELTVSTTTGVTYDVRLHVIYASPAGAGTPDLSYELADDASGNGLFSRTFLSTADSATVNGFVTNAGGLTAGTAAADRALTITGTYVSAGSALTFQWAQAVSGLNATIVRAGSTMRLTPISDAAGGGGGGSTAWGDITGKPTFNLSWLEDADTTGAIDGAVLKYDEAAAEWQVATDDAGGEGSSGPVTLSAGDRERLDLNWWGVWAIVGLLLVLMIAPQLMSVMRVTRGMADGRG